MYAVLASAALLATGAVAQSIGSAIVVNKCNYDVYLANTPAQFGGYDTIEKTLSSGDQYSQQWTELTNSQGWSIKLSKTAGAFQDNLLQYEYTFHDDGIIWYDLSAVNGNPWDSNWEITADSPSGTCAPKQQAYRYATDDAYGMQDCPQDSVVTVTLCSGEEQNDGAAASASSSVAAVTSSLAAATTAWSSSVSSVPSSSAPAPIQTSSEAASSTTEVASSAPETTAVPLPSTTFSTRYAEKSFATTNGAGVTVTEVATAVVTEVATVTHWWGRPHQKRHGHAHPHA